MYSKRLAKMIVTEFEKREYGKIVLNQIKIRNYECVSKHKLIAATMKLQNSFFEYSRSDSNSYIGRNFDIAEYRRKAIKFSRIASRHGYADVLHILLHMQNVSLNLDELLEIAYDNDADESIAFCERHGAKLNCNWYISSFF